MGDTSATASATGVQDLFGTDREWELEWRPGVPSLRAIALHAIMRRLAELPDAQLEGFPPELSIEFFNPCYFTNLETSDRLDRLLQLIAPNPLVGALDFYFDDRELDIALLAEKFPALRVFYPSGKYRVRHLDRLASIEGLQVLGLGAEMLTNTDLLSIGSFNALTRLKLDSPGELTPRAMNAISHLPQIQVFELSGLPSLGAGRGLSEFRRTATLRWITVSSVPALAKGAIQELGELTQLRGLALTRVFNPDASAFPDLSPLANLHHLVCLEVGAFSDRGEWVGWGDGFRHLAGLTSLRALGFSEYGVWTEAGTLALPPCLEQVRLNCCELGSEHTVGQLIAPTSCQRLKLFGESAGKGLRASPASALQHLRRLVIGSTNWEADDANDIFETFAGLAHLESLSLMPLSFKESLPSGRYLRGLTQLTHLTIHGIEGAITREGMGDLRAFDRLEKLSVRGVGLPPDCLVPFLHVVTGLTRLRRVRLSQLTNWEFGDDGIQRAREQEVLRVQLCRAAHLDRVDISGIELTRKDAGPLIAIFGSRLIWEPYLSRRLRGTELDQDMRPSGLGKGLWRQIME